MVCLVGAEHVKFEYGVSGRVYRQLMAARLLSMQNPDAPLTREPALKTVMLNPVPADAYDKRDASLKLEMSVENSPPIPIADYLWFSSAADAKPRRRDPKSWLLPPSRGSSHSRSTRSCAFIYIYPRISLLISIISFSSAQFD